MAVTYERIVGRRMRVTRSKPSPRLEASKRWRRIEEPAANQQQVTDGVPPSMQEVATKPSGEDDAGPPDEQAEPSGTSKSRTSGKTRAGQSGNKKQDEEG